MTVTIDNYRWVTMTTTEHIKNRNKKFMNHSFIDPSPSLILDWIRRIHTIKLNKPSEFTRRGCTFLYHYPLTIWIISVLNNNDIKNVGTTFYYALCSTCTFQVHPYLSALSQQTIPSLSKKYYIICQFQISFPHNITRRSLIYVCMVSNFFH